MNSKNGGGGGRSMTLVLFMSAKAVIRSLSDFKKTTPLLGCFSFGDLWASSIRAFHWQDLPNISGSPGQLVLQSQ